MFKPVNMKLFFLLLIISLTAVAGCKKTGTTAVSNPAANNTNTPGLIGGGFQPGIPFSTSEFNIYDLDHDNNNDKKYFRIELYSTDSARIVMAPKPIDSLSINWPAAVKKIRWSPGAEFIVDNNSYIRISGGGFVQTSYSPTSPQHAWIRQNEYTIFNPLFPARLPDADVFINGEYHLLYLDQTHPYIDKVASTTLNGYQQYNVYSMSDFYAALPGLAGQAFDLYDYTNVTDVIYQPVTSKYYFFDFKNWRYWVIDRPGGLNEGFVAHPIKSLDKFLKWPAGWGKK
ncbi:hypothetical protein GCM10027043_13510 [Ferruginibacter profundus]